MYVILYSVIYFIIYRFICDQIWYCIHNILQIYLLMQYKHIYGAIYYVTHFLYLIIIYILNVPYFQVS